MPFSFKNKKVFATTLVSFLGLGLVGLPTIAWAWTWYVRFCPFIITEYLLASQVQARRLQERLWLNGSLKSRLPYH